MKLDTDVALFANGFKKEIKKKKKLTKKQIKLFVFCAKFKEAMY